MPQEEITPLDPANQPTGDNSELLDRTIRHVRRMWSFRRPYDEKRLIFYRQYLSQRDGQKYPDNVTQRANTFVPYPLSNVETIVSRTMDAFFSFDPWFEVKPRGLADEAPAEKMQLVLQQKLHRANLYGAFSDLVRNICIYGFGGIKVDWDWDYDLVNYAEPVFATDPNGQPIMQPVLGPDGQPGLTPVVLGARPAVKKVPRARPKFYAIDIYDLLVDPDGGMVAHLVERSFGQLKREAEVNPDLYHPEALERLANKLRDDKNADEVIIRMAEVWDSINNTITLVTMNFDAEAVAYKDARYSFRSGATYRAYKRRMYAGEPILLYHGSNSFMHKRAPVLFTSYIKIPNEVYGLGPIEIISDLTEGLNQMVNMIRDNWNLGINRRYAFDVNADIDHESLNLLNVPGGKVGVNGKPDDVIAPLPFFTPQAGDYQILSLYKNMVEVAGGVTDFYHQGVGSSGENDTATGITSIINESNYRFKLFIRNLEMDILQPLLEMAASLVQQYLTDEEEVQVTDAPPGIPKNIMVRPEELLGGLSFQLVAANYATNKVVRQRNALALMNLLATNPATALFLNPYEVSKELFKLFEVRGSNRLLKSPQQVAMEQAAAKQEQLQLMLLEHALETDSKVRQARARGKEGRPAKTQLEGKIPGMGSAQSAIREYAQSIGANALGLEGLGQVPGS